MGGWPGGAEGYRRPAPYVRFRKGYRMPVEIAQVTPANMLSTELIDPFSNLIRFFERNA
jgi:hypothetical protein